MVVAAVPVVTDVGAGAAVDAVGTALAAGAAVAPPDEPDVATGLEPAEPTVWTFAATVATSGVLKLRSRTSPSTVVTSAMAPRLGNMAVLRSGSGVIGDPMVAHRPEPSLRPASP